MFYFHSRLSRLILRTISFISFCTLYVSAFSQERADILVKNGRVLDGTGNSWYYADVAVKDGKIWKIGRMLNVEAKREIDAKGLIVSPGFIDVHTHIEGEELKTPTAENFIYDGVTTVVTGNCGSSVIDIRDYFRFLDSAKLSINVATLIGHNDVRKAVMGRANRQASEQELNRMEQMVEKAMQDGAVGLSTGLIYIPGTYAPSSEITRLAKVAAAYHGVYASHMRNESDSVTEAINEAIQIGRSAHIPVEISHFKCSGQQNWKRSAETLAQVIEARKEGIDVTIDQYPYTASSTSLSTLLPDVVLSDGSDSVMARLQRPDVKKFVIDDMLRVLRKRKLKHFSYAVVASFKYDSSYNGKSIEAVNLMKGRKHLATAEAQTIIDMMMQGGAGMVFHGMSEWDVRNIMTYPFNMFASDAGIRTFGQGVPHPRGYGTNARVLGKYVREEKLISLEEAIRRMTSLPAQKFQLNNRGLLKEGMAADLLVFDEQTITDHSTFDNPHAYSTGIRFVVVNGELVVDEGKHLGVRSGRPLYGPGK